MKASVKRWALNACGKLGPHQYRPPGGVLFPCGHAIADAPPVHVKHLFPVPSAAKFQTDLDLLCRNFKPLDVSDLKQLPQRRVCTSPRSFVLSFDDGLREVHDVIAPMLSRQGIPAIFFINSSTIDNQRLMWRNKISLLIEQARKQPGRSPPQLSSHPNADLEHKLLSLRFAYEHDIDDIGEFYEIDFNEYLRRNKPYLTTDQVLSLARAGFAVGAHGDTHGYFQDMTSQDQQNEISTSVAFIRKLGVPCDYFAFPFHDEGVSTSVFKHLEELGVALSFGTSEARVDSIAFAFHRFSIDDVDSDVLQILKQLSARSMLRRFSGSELVRRSS